MEHLDQLYPRLDITLHHVLWRTQQEKSHPPVEYALYPRAVVDRRVDRHRVTLGRTSIKIRRVTPHSHRDVSKALSFRGVNGTYFLMECWAVQMKQSYSCQSIGTWCVFIWPDSVYRGGELTLIYDADVPSPT